MHDVDALLSLGIQLAEQGRRQEAMSHWRQVLRIRPDAAPAYHNLGVAFAQEGQPEKAIEHFQQAIRLNPQYAEAYCNLGIVLLQLKKRTEAVAAYKNAIRARPDYGDAYNNLGVALNELGQHDEAGIILDQATRLKPGSAEAHNNLGLAYESKGWFEKADHCYREALRLNPNYAEAHSNRGNNFKDQGRFDEALACYQIALWQQPELVAAHWNRSLAWLAKGDFEQGWSEYEWRWKRPQTPIRPFREPRWDGSSLEGKTILVWMEQGLGDMIQFIRYTALLRQRGATVTVECPPFLIPLFSRCPGIDRLVAEGTPLPAFDMQVPLMSLPGLFETTLGTIPAKVPYLTPDPELVEHWRGKLNEYPGFKIGIAWQGNLHYAADRYRSFPLKHFAALAQLPDVRLFNLQKGSGHEQLQFCDRFPVIELTEELDTTSGAFMDTAAIMQSLDLVIVPDTAVAHLAGSLGVPVWVPVPAVPDWRWLFGREDSSWYPSMRLFRQKELGDWREVFEGMAEACSEKQKRHFGAKNT